MRSDHENMVVSGQVRLQPDDSTQIQVIRGLIEEEKMGLDEQCSGKGDTHTPSSRHVLRGFLHHRLGESETMQDAARLCLEC